MTSRIVGTRRSSARTARERRGERLGTDRGRGGERTDGEDVVVVLHLGASGHGEGADVAARVPSGLVRETADASASGGGEDGKSSGAVASGDREAHQTSICGMKNPRVVCLVTPL